MDWVKFVYAFGISLSSLSSLGVFVGFVTLCMGELNSLGRRLTLAACVAGVILGSAMAYGTAP